MPISGLPLRRCARGEAVKGTRACYGCGGSGQRGTFECAGSSGTGIVTGRPVQAHTDSFRAGTLRTTDRPAGKPKRQPTITVRRRWRSVTEETQ